MVEQYTKIKICLSKIVSFPILSVHFRFVSGWPLQVRPIHAPGGVPKGEFNLASLDTYLCRYYNKSIISIYLKHFMRHFTVFLFIYLTLESFLYNLFILYLTLMASLEALARWLVASGKVHIKLTCPPYNNVMDVHKCDCAAVHLTLEYL